ncbi:MAG TPA: hypothetical protein VKU00_02935 [Chthonomonadaceae bacterium]|nr:hypothetical protein [Chthonomonadaceae bacterium]
MSDTLQYCVQLLQDLLVPKPDYLVVITTQEGFSLSIVFLLLIVDVAIHFHYQTVRGSTEIHDKPFCRILASKPDACQLMSS